MVQILAAHSGAGIPDCEFIGLAILPDANGLEDYSAGTGRCFPGRLQCVHRQFPKHHRLRALLNLAGDSEINVADREWGNLGRRNHQSAP